MSLRSTATRSFPPVEVVADSNAAISWMHWPHKRRSHRLPQATAPRGNGLVGQFAESGLTLPDFLFSENHMTCSKPTRSPFPAIHSQPCPKRLEHPDGEALQLI